MPVFVIEDESHAEWCGEFSSYGGAFEELERRAKIAWDASPNACPCTNSKNCSRQYSIIEFDTARKPWQELSRLPVLEISAGGVVWRAGQRHA